MSGHLSTFAEPDADFDAIEQAVMETERGRTFLKEYARRNRHADTQVLLTSLSRIEKSIALRQSSSAMDEFKSDILEMADVIARSRKEIASLQPDDSSAGPFVEASDHLESIVLQTETTTSLILAAAEGIQESAWTLRETGADEEQCAKLDELATVIYTSCSSQDVTVQRTRKIIGTLNFLENRLSALAEICGVDRQVNVDIDDDHAPSKMSQEDIDFVLIDTEITVGRDTVIEQPMPPRYYETAAQIDAAENAVLSEPAFEPAAAMDDVLFDTSAAVQLAPIPEEPTPLALVSTQEIAQEISADEFEVQRFASAEAFEAEMPDAIQKAQAGASLSADEAARALDALKNMSVEQRSQLFS